MTSRRFSRYWLDVVSYAAYAAIVSLLAMVYLRQAVVAGGGALLMPVDDAYIHFQYARQAAFGEPFVYNASGEPSSGATSLLYPFVLAAGYQIGFIGLDLGYWAAISGGFALFASAVTVRAMSRAAGLPRWQYDLIGAAVAGWGALVWHAFSGMETALVVALALLTLHFFERRHLRAFAVSASILAMLRPEASVMAVIAAVLYFVRELNSRRILPLAPRSEGEGVGGEGQLSILYLLIPVLAALAQPLLNLALTGTANATGSQAKSLLSIVPFDFGYVAGRIVENFLRAWEGFFFGIDRAGLWSLPPLLGIAALIGFVRVARSRPMTAILTALWLVGAFAAIATLDTAFWHFKRYHMPLLALAFPLTAYAAMGLTPRGRAVLVGWTVLFALFLNVLFVGYHKDNVESVAAQPLAMARWLAGNTPPDSLVAVHDVGLIRYVGGRDTLDMVGLTTPGMADAWRNGPGAVGEALIHAERRPDYIAAYTDARGLSYLADSLYGEELTFFVHGFDSGTNVALGGTFQGIYRPTWEGADAAARPQVDSLNYEDAGDGLTDTLNVAELASEQAHNYRWENVSRYEGFATDIYLLDTPGCSSDCRVLDGGRRLNGTESFTMQGDGPPFVHILVSRFLAPNGGRIRVTAGGTSIERTLPAIPGQFVEIPTLIPRPRGYFEGMVSVRIENLTPDLVIYSYHHWLYRFNADEQWPGEEPQITYQDNALELMYAGISVTADYISMDIGWWTDGTATGDYITFYHLYSDLNEPPVRQLDQRLYGVLPPGAWLPGFSGTTVRIPIDGLSPGTYFLAIGFYDPVTFERLVPNVLFDEYTVSERRVIIGTIDIPPPE